MLHGTEVGARLIKNVWLSVGYNFSGFYDGDFGDADYWASGPYFKTRIKADESLIADMF
jgi:hypothetical protein